MILSKSVLYALGLGLGLCTQARARTVLNTRQQDIVTWDDHSLLINGERVMIFSAEIHPFRLPVPGLWPDVLQKIKAAGYNCVSIYIDWQLLEGERGTFLAEGIFSQENFFAAAKAAGLYVVVRPGPYVNAEVSGGGFPGWLSRVEGTLRTNGTDYLAATELYMREINAKVADAQITNGGPVILVQIENEYTDFAEGYQLPSYDYWDKVKKQYTDAGIVVPLFNNEASMKGYITTSTPADVDIYGFDSYPVGFDCENPTAWPSGGIDEGWLAFNNELAPDSPLTIPEFQGGGFQAWGSTAGFESCAALVNMEFERVFYKNNYAVGATIFNIYMTYGGTNWGNLGHSDGFTSYDYGAQITEDRLVWREKYSEVKIQANFFHVSPGYLEADRFNPSLEYTDTEDITVTPATTNTTKFYITRHTTYDSVDSTPYKLTVKTVDYGDIQIPQLGNDTLVLNGRDSKIHLSDYPVGDDKLVYSSAEVFTWKKYDDKTVLVLYGGPNEHHEIAVEDDGKSDYSILQGDRVSVERSDDDYIIISLDISDDVTDRKVVKMRDGLYIYILNRNEAYDFWVPSTGVDGDYGTSDIILKAGYLVRSAQADGDTLNIVGDVNATTTIEVIGGVPADLKALSFNGNTLDFTRVNGTDAVKATVDFTKPEISLPSLESLSWKKIDSLPEVSDGYDDSAWVDANLTTSPNDFGAIDTPVSLRAGDYGFQAGSVLFRGHFTANGNESKLDISAQGGLASGSSVWLDSTFLGSWTGTAADSVGNSTFDVNSLSEGTEHVITVVVDLTGINENYVIGEDSMKEPRGIIKYDLASHDAADITWKVQGTLGGESYPDKTRGPLNEGGLFAERKGYHLPSPPSSDWEGGSPTDASSAAGITLYSAAFDLDLPDGYDIPLSVEFDSDVSGGSYRVQIFVNGYQYGKFVPHIGPQKSYPIPEGIVNHHGTNTIAITVWSMEEKGAQIKGLGWTVGMVSKSGFGDVESAPAPEWKERAGSY
ncbi:beta-galactosidase [Geosmithia morbida]|uniref:Beta-galactosidase n=1 Tax=Geosmithia morbida TaxID=1094350 RepID=A0A9P5D6I8_9HYPO|nr:beta-galactosidase [Geosmithia morbida]KAF4124805.1 beta-galactosidase [Geosmithia morbida]